MTAADVIAVNKKFAEWSMVTTEEVNKLSYLKSTSHMSYNDLAKRMSNVFKKSFSPNQVQFLCLKFQIKNNERLRNRKSN